MTQQDRASKNQQKLNKQPEHQPAAIGPEYSGGELSELAPLPGDTTLLDQTERLSNPGLLSAQRQAIAVQIGHLQGNQHLQRVMAEMGSSSQPSPSASPLIQREGEQTTAERGGGTYEVVSRDTLWGIAKTTYGHGRHWQAIYRANPNKAFDGGNLIYVGTILTLPVLQVTVAAEEAEPPATEGEGTGPAIEPPGYGTSTEFGDYWVVPDDTNQSFEVEGEQITETEFAQLQETWDALQNNSGSVHINEADDTGTDHPGFRSMIMTQFGKLMSQPTGRSLVVDLVKGSKTVTIIPSSAQIYGGANASRGAGTLENADGTAGAGGTTTIRVDPGLQDDDVVVFDAAGDEIALPVFVTLGHELIHAQHNAAGRNRRNLAATDSDYSNREEEETIDTGTLTENDIRDEHGLPQRHGHSGRDTRSP